MFDHVGRKIKKLTKVICIIGMVWFALVGIGVMIAGIPADSGFSRVLSGLIIAAIGAFLSWVDSFFAYGFGELVENTTVLAESVKKE